MENIDCSPDEGGTQDNGDCSHMMQCNMNDGRVTFSCDREELKELVASVADHFQLPGLEIGEMLFEVSMKFLVPAWCPDCPNVKLVSAVALEHVKMIAEGGYAS